MNNYQMAVDATTTALNSQGSAMREQEEYNKSLEARINRLNTAWYSFAAAVGENGLYDTIVVVTKALESLTKAGESGLGIFNIYSASLGAVGVALTLLSTRFASLAGAIGLATKAKLMGTSLNAQAATMQGRYTMAVASTDVAVRKLTISKTAYQAKLAATTATTQAATAATATLATAMRSVLLATGVGAAFVVAGIALEKLVSRMSEAAQESEYLESQLKKNTDALTANSDEVTKMLGEYERMSQAKASSSTWDTEKEEEYLSVQQRLGDMFPALVDYIDTSGQSHLKNSEEIEKEIELTNNLIKAQKEQIKTEAKDTIGKRLKDNDKLKKDIVLTNKLIEDTQKKIEKGSWTFDADEPQKNLAKLQVKVREFEMALHNSSDEVISEVLNIADAFTEIKIDNAVKNEIEAFMRTLDFSNMDAEGLKNFAIEIATIMTALQTAFANEDSEGIKTVINDLNNLASGTKDFDASVGGFSTTLETLEKSASNAGKGVGSVVDDTNLLGEMSEETANKIEDLNKSLNDLKTVEEQLVGVSNTHVETSEEQLYMYEQLTGRLQGFNDEQLKDLFNKQQLTSEEKAVVDAYKQREEVLRLLMVLYPDLAVLQGESISLSNEQVEAMKREEKANKVLLEAYKLSKEGKLSFDQEETLSSAMKTKNIIDDIKNQIKALGILEKALQDTYDKQEKLIDKNRMAELKVKIDNDTATDAERMEYRNIGAGAYRAGQLIGQTQSNISSFISELDALQSQQNGNIDTIDKFVSAINESDKATKNSSKSTKESIYITDEYKKKMEQLNLAIEKQQKLQNQYPKHSENYRKALQAEIALQQQKLDLMNSQETSLSSQIKSGKINQTGNISISSSDSSSVSRVAVSGYGGKLTSRQGNRINPVTGKSQYHAGIDLASPLGTRLDSLVSGKVVGQGYNNVSGNYVKIQDASGNSHFFAHLEKAIVKLNDTIVAGQQIGTIGSTGRATGSHLHYEVKDSTGKYLDALTYAKDAMNGLVTTSGSVNSTVSNTLQSIDEANSALISVQSDIANQKELIANLQAADMKWFLDDYGSHRRKVLDDLYSQEEAKLSDINVESERYAKTIEYQTDLLKKKQKQNKDEIAYIEEQIKSGKLNALITDEFKDRLVGLRTEAFELNQAMQSNSAKKYGIFEELREAPSDEIELLRANMELLDGTSLDYVDSLDDIIIKLRELQTINQNELLTLEDDIKNGGFTGQALEDLQDRYEDLKVTIVNTNAEIRSTFLEASRVKLDINNKSIKETQSEIDFLNYKLSLIGDTDIMAKVSVMIDIQGALNKSISKMDNAIKDAIIMRNDAIAMGVSTDMFDDEIDSIIGQRRSQLSEMQNTYNQMQSMVTDAFNKIKEAEDKAYSEASKAIDNSIKQAEKSLKYFSDIIKDFDDKMSLLQESDYSQKIAITTEQVNQTKQLASQIVSEYHRIAATPVYNEEQKEKVESQLSSLKDQLSSANAEIINYTKELEKAKFNKILSGTRKTQREISRLNSILETNLAILDGGRLQGTDISFDFGTTEGAILDLSTLIDNPADSLKSQELQIQDIRSSSYGAQILEAESFHAQMQAQAEQFHSVMIDAVEEFEKMIKAITAISDKEKQAEKEKADREWIKSTEGKTKEELEVEKTHYQNIKNNMMEAMGEYGEEFGYIWDEIILDLEKKLAIIENAMANIGSDVDIDIDSPTSPSTGGGGGSSGGGNSGGSSGDSSGGSSSGGGTKERKPVTEIYDRVRGLKKIFYSDGTSEIGLPASKNKDVGAKTIVEERIEFKNNRKIQKMKDGTTKSFWIPDGFVEAFAKGTDGASGGLSLVGEEGSELVVQKDGTAYLTGDSHELRNLNQGDKVFTADETKKMLTNKKNSISVFADGTGDTLPLDNITPTNILKMIDFNGNIFDVFFEDVDRKFREGLRYVVDGVASTTIELYEHTTGFKKLFDGLTDVVGGNLASGKYKLNEIVNNTDYSIVEKLDGISKDFKHFIDDSFKSTNKDYIDYDSGVANEIFGFLNSKSQFISGKGIGNKEEVLSQVLDYYTGKSESMPDFFDDISPTLLSKFYLDVAKKSVDESYKNTLGNALYQVVTSGNTTHIESFKEHFQGKNAEIDSLSVGEIVEKYQGNYSELSKLVDEGAIFNDYFAEDGKNISQSISEFLKSAYDYRNIRHDDKIPEQDRGWKLDAEQRKFSGAFTNIKNSLPEDSDLVSLLSVFGIDVSDDIYEIGKKISEIKLEDIKKLWRAPENKDQVLVYDSNGIPQAWFSKETADSIIYSGTVPGWYIGSENASEYMNLTPPPANQDNPTIPSEGGNTTPKYNPLEGIETEIGYTEEFKKRNEEYQKDREPRKKKIADLQAQLDEAEKRNDKAEEDRLIKLLVDETSSLDRDDYLFTFDKSMDLANQSKLVAKNAIAELERRKAEEPLTEEAMNDIDDAIADMYAIIADANNNIKSAVAEALEAQNNHWSNVNSKFTDKIDDLEYERDMLDEDDTANRLRLDNEILEQQNLYIESLMKQKAELEDLLRTQEVGTYEWNQTNGALKDVTGAIKDANLSLKDMKDGIKNTTNDIIGVIKKGLEKQRDLEVAELNKRLDEVQKVYRSKLDAIGDRESERTYLNNREDITDEIDKLVKDINRLALNDSQEAIARRLDLEQKLSDKRDELAEMDYQRSVELERKAIETKQKDEEEVIKGNIDDVNWHYDELLANDAKFESLNQEIQNGNLAEAFDMIEDFFKLMPSYIHDENRLRDIGESFQGMLNLIREMHSASKALRDIEDREKAEQKQKAIDEANSGAPAQDRTHNSDGSETAKNEGDIDSSYKVFTVRTNGQIDPNSLEKVVLKDSDGNVIHSKKELTPDGKSILVTPHSAIKRGSYTVVAEGVKSVDGQTAPTFYKDFVTKFDTGGYTGDGEGLAWLDKKEIILKDADTRNLLDAVKFVRDIADFTTLKLPNFNLPKFDIAGQGVSNTYNLDFKFDNFSGSKSDGEQIISKVMTNLRKLGR